MEDIMHTTLTGTLGDASAVMTISPTGDLALSMVLAINGAVTDTDIVDFDSKSDRDEAYSEVVSSMLTAGYQRSENTADGRWPLPCAFCEQDNCACTNPRPARPYSTRRTP